jgi:hypothetical protein
MTERYRPHLESARLRYRSTLRLLPTRFKFLALSSNHSGDLKPSPSPMRISSISPLVCTCAPFGQNQWCQKPFMKDMLVQLEKLRTQAAECAMIRDLATDRAKRELFAKLAEHFNVLAGEVERAIKKAGGKTP